MNKPTAEIHPLFADILARHATLPKDEQIKCCEFDEPLTHEEECDCRECLEYPNHRRGRYYPKLR